VDSPWFLLHNTSSYCASTVVSPNSHDVRSLLPILGADRRRYCGRVRFDSQSRSFYSTVRAHAPSATQPTLKPMPLRCSDIRQLHQTPVAALTNTTPPCCRAEAHTHIVVFATGSTSLRRGNVHTASPFTCAHPMPPRSHIHCHPVLCAPACVSRTQSLRIPIYARLSVDYVAYYMFFFAYRITRMFAEYEKVLGSGDVFRDYSLLICTNQRAVIVGVVNWSLDSTY
jgi:hypothetical protein